MKLGIKFGDEHFLLVSLQGKIAISEPYEFILKVNSPVENRGLEQDLGKPVSFWIEQEHHTEYFHGYVYEASRHPQAAPEQAGWFTYHFVIKPWLARLSLGKNRRNFMKKSTREIIDTLLQENELHEYHWHIGEVPEWQRDYTVQFEESDLSFISRLLSEYGFFYYFTFEKTKSQLHLSNLPICHIPKKLELALAPPYFAGQAYKVVYVLGEKNQITLHTTDPALLPPKIFHLTDDYLIISSKLKASISHASTDFTTHLVGILSDHPPPLPQARKPKFFYPVTAEVIGPTLNTPYADDQGQIKLQFHWDHEAQDFFASPWVKIKRHLRGEKDGAQFTPRVGQEVLVSYEEGDPERPIVLGSLRNGKHLPVYSDFQNYARSGIKTRHEFYLDDHPEHAHIAFTAAGDFDLKVRGDQDIKIGREFSHTVMEGNLEETIDGEFLMTATEKIELLCENSCLRIEPHQITLIADKIQIDPPTAQVLGGLPDPEAPRNSALKNQEVLVLTLIDTLKQAGIVTEPVLAQWISRLEVEVSFTHQDTLIIRPMSYQKIQSGKFLMAGFDANSKNIRITIKDPSRPEAVNIVALWKKPLAMASDAITLEKSSWHQQVRENLEGNTFYFLELTVLQPAILFNFRHDAWLEDPENLTESEQAIYELTTPYRSPGDTVSSAPPCHQPKADQLSLEELRYFKNNESQACIFIHGFHVASGDYGRALELHPFDPSTIPLAELREISPLHLSATEVVEPSLLGYTLHRNPETLKKMYGQALENYLHRLKNMVGLPNLDNGSDACTWLTTMEYNLNQAAGFDGQNYEKYTRIIGINWQGNPKTVDYIAAPLLADFPARKIVALIQQLQAYGVAHIQLMAHSLGNAVLMKTLSLCAAHKIKIEQAFLWQPAIPNWCFASPPRYVFPMVNPHTPNPAYPLHYHYPAASEGAKSFTVLYSNHDNILGPLPKNAQTTDAHGFIQQCLEDFYRSHPHPHQSYLITNISKLLTGKDLVEPTARSVLLKAKSEDAAAGISYACIAEVIFLLDQFELPKISEHQKLLSIYHIANLLGYPFDYFFTAPINHSQAFYENWCEHYTHFSTPKGQYRMPASLAILQAIFYRDLNHVYTALSCGLWYWLLYQRNHILENLYDLEKAAIQDAEARLEMSCKTQLSHIFGKSISESTQFYFENPESNAIASVFLLALLTDNAAPAPAMGYTGAHDAFQNYHAVDQGNLLPDHNGMLMPTEIFRQEIYKKILMQNHETGFNTFGRY